MSVVPIAIQNGFTHFDFEAFSEDTIKVGIDFVNTPNSKKASNFHRITMTLLMIIEIKSFLEK